MEKIIIEVSDIKLEANLLDTATASMIFDTLPLQGTANVWGDEIYFSIPVHIDQEPEAREEVEIGDLGFWPAGDAFCIFYGPTPVSTSDKPRAYSPVNIFGKIDGDATILKKVSSGEIVKVSASD